jgi:hypothetical protein
LNEQRTQKCNILGFKKSKRNGFIDGIFQPENIKQQSSYAMALYGVIFRSFKAKFANLGNLPNFGMLKLSPDLGCTSIEE